MFVHEELLAIIFRLVNFGLLVFLCIHVFRRYVLPVIHQHMQDEQEQQRQIRKRHAQITEQEAMVERTAYEQQELCQKLRQKVHDWQSVHERLCEQREFAKSERIVQLRKRALLQERILLDECKKKAVVPHMLKEVQGYLENRYQSDEHGQDFVARVVRILKKEA